MPKKSARRSVAKQSNVRALHTDVRPWEMDPGSELIANIGTSDTSGTSALRLIHSALSSNQPSTTITWCWHEKNCTFLRVSKVRMLSATGERLWYRAF